MSDQTYTICELSRLLNISKANVCQLLTPRFRAHYLTIVNDQIVVTQAGADAMQHAIDKGVIIKSNGPRDQLAAEALKKANIFSTLL